jgi:SAM-dependent methyltransferase
VSTAQPHRALVALVADLPPGVAVAVGCGEGADVVWLAERGWRVTGVDASEDVLDRGRRYAGEAGVADRASWVCTDLADGQPLPELPGGADLVTTRATAYAQVAAVVRHGGTLLLTGDHDAAVVRAALGPAWAVDVADTAVRARRTTA